MTREINDGRPAKVFVCLEKPRCDKQTPMPCPLCYVIEADDKRSVDEHIKIMNRTN